MEQKKLAYLIEVAKTGDGAAAATGELEKLTKAADGVQAGLGKATAAQEGISSALVSLGARYLTVTGIVLGFAKLGSDSVKAYEEQETAIRRMEGSLRSLGQYSSQFSRDLQGLAGDLQSATGVADEKILDVSTRLIQLGASSSNVERFTEMVLNLQAAGYDLGSATSAIGGALAGEFGQLGRILKTDFPEGAGRAENLAKALELVDQRFTGLARATSLSATGFGAAKIEFAEFQESLGELVKTMANPVLDKLATMVRFLREGSGALGAHWFQQAPADLLDQQFKLQRALQAEIEKRLELGQVTDVEARRLRDYVKVVGDAGFMFNRLKIAREALLSGKPLPSDAAQTDPAKAKRELEDLLLEQKLMEARMDAGLPRAFDPLGAIARAEQANRVVVGGQLSRGQIDEIAHAELVKQGMQRRGSAEAELAQQASVVVEQAHQQSMSVMGREQAQIEADYDRRTALVRAYYSIIMGSEEEASAAIKLVQMQREQALYEATATGKLLVQVGQQGAQQFSQGLAGAFVSFASGAKSAKEAFSQFASSFMQQIAQMIMQALILRAVQGIFGALAPAGQTTGGWGAVSSGVAQVAEGGMLPRRMAAGGLQSVSSATFFPQFGAIAGEAGTEIMAVLSRPRMMDMGGLASYVGKMQGRDMAMTDAGELRSAVSGQRSAGGLIVIEVRGSADFETRLISSSVDRAVVQINTELATDSATSAAVKSLTA